MSPIPRGTYQLLPADGKKETESGRIPVVFPRSIGELLCSRFDKRRGSVLRSGPYRRRNDMTSASERINPSNPIVETTHGKVRGESVNGVNVFRGIPYGASTAGRNRFMPPVEPTSWAGVRDALSYGPSAPQNPSTMRGLVDPRSGFASFGDADGIAESEDCLVLNIWTRGLGDGRKRPVMFWCHGGGFASSSGSPLIYSGTNLARRGDVVVVTVNHRLGALGYTFLASVGGGQFASSSNVGMLDLVAALKWVRDNIARFGGDAANVTIFGESGGGQKVSTLLAMPPATGLFHRAVIQSGPGFRMNETEHAGKVAAMFLDELGIGIGIDRGEVQGAPVEKILAAQASVEKKLGRHIPGFIQGFAPVVDGVTLRNHPFDPAAPEISADVPVIIGYNRTEMTLFVAAIAGAFSLDENTLRKRAGYFLGADAERVIEVFRAENLGATPSELMFLIGTEFPTAAFSRKIAERKTALGKAPGYLYRFDWETPIMGGLLKSPHALEIPFVFDNAGEPLAPRLTPEGAEVRALAAAMSARWIAFARTGDPNPGEAPHWSPYTASERATMIFNRQCRIENDPAPAARAAIDGILFARAAG
jgi:para-nitrobenzyl esterase